MPPELHPCDPLLTVKQLAERLGVSVSLAYRLLARGDFLMVRIGIGGGVIRIPESEIDRYLTKNRR